ncbi:Cytochrome b ascorbate-dependent protein 3 [Acipenser ruthenus]|uniref:Lysosomal membrane ascorbate-dependent ferrireductase CYB561A3 n=1 Tax=Acipenser ruthenus TaxID=7906 RepID=A0A444UMJ2_ACIRT|nr:lysosomal membrane ascorbate-dependent ferrireductase CYB561A3 [Acipenser ruthenus]XP_058858915.1 lysosomal membrane ascorbate-dependent ferrireductase CYB561A3 [Acipenser ruthenus]XP_058858916.1 lysosomal membrane ascorbate-dependent ferrireductase CYB561A3 [Acipenser ruthenus]RXM36396.1 Cytochrome b ascorbate-dependent protein 3 [Acipenser ruthenus]
MRVPGQLYLTYLLALCLGLLCMVFVAYWNATWRGGFAWDGSAKQFNWHPVLMVAGLTVLYGSAAVLYRLPLTWGGSKLPWKLLHAGLTLLSFLLAVLGLFAVFNFHNKGNTPNLYSLHSWIGISTVALFTGQWLLGLASFLLPCTPLELRRRAKPLHVWLGSGIFILGIAASISGINEKLIFSLKGLNGTAQYSALPQEAQFANMLGVLIVAFGLTVLRILSNQAWQRPEGENSEVTQPLLQD